jgi:hypothetical protein
MTNKHGYAHGTLAIALLGMLAVLPVGGCATSDAAGDDSTAEASSDLTVGTAFYDLGRVCVVGGAAMHCCPPGQAMIGAHVDRNIFKCASVPLTGFPFLDVATVRGGMHACQFGAVMVGLQAGKNQLACQFTAEAIGSELVDHGTQDTDVRRPADMHVCPEFNGWVMAGIHVGNNLLLCDR